MWIKQNDIVAVITGEDRGTQGKVLRLTPKTGKLVVEGVNRVYKHVRRSQKNPQGGRLSMEMPIPLSNVALVCQSCKRPARIGARMLSDGGKERYCKKCGAGIGLIAPPKTKQAKTQTRG
jgi:large subunit ribosomal protein L24